MKQIINTVLFGRRKSYIFGALLTVIGLYIGFLFWYLIANNWVRPTINILVLIICILVAGNVLLALYKIPEQLCSNPNIEHLLNFPIKVSQIIYAVIFRLCKVQVLIYICFFIPYILFFNDKISLTISYGLICILLSMIFDCLIFVLMIGIPFISKKFCGYTILVIQYGGFLLIIGLGAYSFIEYLANPLLLWNISNWIQSYYMILFPILLLILFLGFVTVTRMSKTCYLKSYYYLLTFTKPAHRYKRNPFCNSPYFLIEWCRVTRNKELFFYSSIKSVITVYLLNIDYFTRTITDSKGDKIHLTAKEFDLLYFLSSHKGQVFTKEQIYEKVWGYDNAPDASNLSSFIRKLRLKIEPHPDNPRYIITVWGVGYKFSGEEKP